MSSYAQSKKKKQPSKQQQTQDSIRNAQKAAMEQQREARERAADSLKAERARIADSTTAARKHFSDSLAKVRSHRSDSLEAIRKYKTSNRYKDSVSDARARVADSIRDERQALLDMEREERQRITDSITAIRQHSIDSLRAIQKRRSDSLSIVREYRESRRYSDSVDVIRERRMDSLTAMRKHINDSIASVRKRITDSATASRKHILDSTTAARKEFTDSLTAVRKQRADSLAVVREKREKQQKQAAKDREKKMVLAAELKIKSKQEAWNNKKMLKKKWSVPRQVIQNSFTRYNYYFNANNKMKEATANMQRVNRENLDSFIALYPFNPDRDSSLIAPDMDSVIRKVSLGIQIHDPRTKWADDLYLLLGQAFYYKGDYKNASNSFRYIVGMEQRVKKKKSSGYARPKGQGPSVVQEEKESALDFLKHKSVNNEAILWLSRTFVQAGQPENAEAVLDLVASDPKFPENMKGQLAMAKAYLALNNNNIKDAAAHLQVAADDNYLDNEQRQRAAYLSAQIFQQNDDYVASTENFQKVVDLHPAIEMDFYARKNIAMNAINSGEKREESIASLKKILRDYKYSNYYEQVYFILGRLSSKSGQNDEAIAYLQQSINSSRTTKKQKAISFAALGDIYYRTGDYVAAKNYYDSSALLAKNAPDDESVTEAVRLGNALSSVTGPYLTIKTNDSLLALASLSEKEQRSVIREHLRTLIRAKEDSAFNAENGGVTSIAQNEGNINNGGGGGWYFANSTQMTKGKNEFKRIWGNRPPVDNWRRMSEIGFVSNSNNSSSLETEVEDEYGLLYDENGLPTEESLMALLPTDAERQEKIHKEIQKAYVDLSDAYIMQLEDYNLADRALDTLDVRYKDHPDKARELYLRYIMAVRLNRVPEARSYAQQIQIQYPGSEYATLVKPTEDNIGLPTNSNMRETVANYYDATYSLLMQRQFTEVLQRINIARQRYKDKNYEKRFTVMEGVAFAGAGNFAKADTLLNNFIKGNNKDTLVAWAEEVLKYVNKNKPVAPKVDTSLVKSVVDTTVAKAPPVVNTNNNITGTVEIAKPTGDVPPIFAYKPEVEHYVLISFPGMDARAMGMKAAVGDLNSFKYKNENLSSGIDMLSQKEGVVVVKKFPSAAKAKSYMEGLRATGQLFREYQSSEYQVFSISASNYQKLLADHSISQYLNFYKFYYK